MALVTYSFDLGEIVGKWAQEILGAAAAAGTVWMGNFIRAAWINYRYPVAGTYMTKFEDIEDGKKIVSKAPAVLRQKGRKIKGETYIGNKAWILEGKIVDGGHIYGFYSAVSPHDPGIGTFFLEMSRENHLDGFWTGYDAENKVVTSGRYTFRKAPDFKIDMATDSDLPHILSISSDTLGEGYVESLLEKNENTGKKGTLLIVARVGRDTVGYCFAYRVQQSDWNTIIKGRDVRLPIDVRHALEAGHLGIIQTLAVHPDFQGCGIGSALLNEAIDRLMNRGLKRFISLAWKSSSGINIKSLLERSGFKPIVEIEEFWTDDSLKSGFECPECGHPCKCAAVLYKR